MKTIIDLVDDIEYTKSNCFAHQLHACLSKIPNVKTVQLSDIKAQAKPDLIVSRLKQRTLYRNAKSLATWAKDTPIVVFDQDPWCAFSDGSDYKGAYASISSLLNVVSYAVTTKWWVDFLNSKGFPSTFVRMGLLPEYCSCEPKFIDRKIEIGFIGSLHPYRKKLFDDLSKLDISINLRSGYNYSGYMQALSDLQCFIHSEDAPFTIDGKEANLNVGLWVKDLEAAARGCFSIRNRGIDSESYLEGIKTVRLYDSIEDILKILQEIRDMSANEKQNLIEETVSCIKKTNNWMKTAEILTSF